MTPPSDVIARLRALPIGTHRGIAFGKPYIATRSAFSGGRAIKLVAEELGGNGYISLNLYDLAQGPQLYPCEMPSAKVIEFVRNFQADPPANRDF
jgi:hypothetical protein